MSLMKKLPTPELQTSPDISIRKSICQDRGPFGLWQLSERVPCCDYVMGRCGVQIFGGNGGWVVFGCNMAPTTRRLHPPRDEAW